MTFDLHKKTIGIIYPPRAINIPSLKFRQLSLIEIMCLQGLQTLTHGDLKWHLTSMENNRDHLLTKRYQLTKLKVQATFTFWDTVFTRFLVFDLWWPLARNQKGNTIVCLILLLRLLSDLPMEQQSENLKTDVKVGQEFFRCFEVTFIRFTGWNLFHFRAKPCRLIPNKHTTEWLCRLEVRVKPPLCGRQNIIYMHIFYKNTFSSPKSPTSTVYPEEVLEQRTTVLHFVFPYLRVSQ